MSDAIRVLIVDDHAVVRAGLRMLRRGGGHRGRRRGRNGRQAIYETIENKPNVILMDVVMPEKSGIEAIPSVLEAAPEAKVLVLSMQDDPSYEGGVRRRRVRLRPQGGGGRRGRAAVREVANGGSYVHPALGARLVAAEAEARIARGGPAHREREVLRLLALGHTNQEIAKMLFISVRTAETHRAHHAKAPGSTPSAELVRYALERGLLDEGAAES